MALLEKFFVSRLSALTLAAILVLSLTGGLAMAQVPAIEGNKAERLEWFRDLGFGLFIHWGLSSLRSVRPPGRALLSAEFQRLRDG